MSDRSVILPPAQQELKVAFTALRRAFGGQVEAAAATGYRQQEISDWERPNVAQFPRLDALAALESMTVGLPGHPHVTRLLAGRAGFALAPLPVTGGVDCLLTALARTTVELGDLGEAIVALRAGPGVDASVCLRAVEEASELIERAVQLHAALVGVLSAGGAGGR